MGVKSLWQLLDPVGRPVLLETMEGRSMAIDSSIWIYQFQATMRDKEGRGLVNAHVLGFLRRICKLLFYGIKPVFVFDGGAPALKRNTITERKRKKSGAAISHAKLAERLLAAQMRREALNYVRPAGKGKGKASDPVVLDENTVYLEDLQDDAPATPKKQGAKSAPSPPSSKKKSRWQDHDPYKLPEVNLQEVIARATSSTAPDPRLATEEELRAFLEELQPEELDMTSPEFHELPTEVKYEIIGDLRIRSRQTSHKRLQAMLRNSRTPLDFSKEQIKALKQRNALTQQLLTTTDSIGKAHVEIPIRIASERNRQYVLVKNEGEDLGWVLGIRDDAGTSKAKPIEIDQEKPVVPVDGSEESDEDMEEVEVPIMNGQPQIQTAPFDPDLREFRRGQALTAMGSRNTSKGLAPLNTRPARPKPKLTPLFAPEEDEEVSDADLQIDLAIQESLESARVAEEASVREAMVASRSELSRDHTSNVGASTSQATQAGAGSSTPARRMSSSTRAETWQQVDDDEAGLYASPNRMETAFSIAGVGTRRPPNPSDQRQFAFGLPILLMPDDPSAEEAIKDISVEEEEDMEEVPVPSASTTLGVEARVPPSRTIRPMAQPSPVPIGPSPLHDESDDEMEEVLPAATSAARTTPTADRSAATQAVVAEDVEDLVEGDISVSGATVNMAAATYKNTPADFRLPSSIRTSVPSAVPQAESEQSESEDEDGTKRWSRSPSPATVGSSKPDAVPVESTADGWDAADEMDPHVEEREFAQFLSQVKGRDIDSVRKEIDEEIADLNQQRKNALRDSEDVTQQMISQIMIMLRLFGIPYITAPMEAEAQCAKLLELELVHGVITDDSDVFLFGGARVLKNMFNQSKTVECFQLSDLDRELGLDRDKLIRLAYLLGSDYTDGLPGVGPVVAMELLEEFPGPDGLHKFKDWWQRVQSGKDRPEESNTRFRKRFKRRFKDLYLLDEWPNPAVRDAYYHPTVDESEEPFKWGLPDLDALRHFFDSELGWGHSKVDDLLLPIIQKMGKRGQSSSLNKQGNLGNFFDVPVGSAAPRKRQAYDSKRLQNLIMDHRKKRDHAERERSQSASGSGSASAAGKEDAYTGKPAKKRRTTKASGKGKQQDTDGTAKTASHRGGKATRARRGKAGTARKKEQAETASENEDQGDVDAVMEVGAAGTSPGPLSVNLRPRPNPRPAYRGVGEHNRGGDSHDLPHIIAV